MNKQPPAKLYALTDKQRDTLASMLSYIDGVDDVDRSDIMAALQPRTIPMVVTLDGGLINEVGSSQPYANVVVYRLDFDVEGAQGEDYQSVLGEDGLKIDAFVSVSGLEQTSLDIDSISHAVASVSP